MFFTSMYQMMTEGVDLTLVIRKANGQLTVSTLPKSNGLKDEAQNHIVPLTVTGLPQELDAGFLQTIVQPIQKASGLISNMAQFEAQADKAAADSKAAKEVKAKETKEEKEKREKYEKHFKKAEEQIAEGNHKDAVTTLGQARLYAKPEQQKKIDEMIAAQRKEMDKGSLFGMMEEQHAPQPQQTVATPQQHAQPVPQYQPQPQRPIAAQAPVGQQKPQPAYAQPAPGQQPSMFPPEQPMMQRPMQHQAPPQPQYQAQPAGIPQPQPQPQYPGYPNYQRHEESFIPEDGHAQPQYMCDEPAYRPEDYEEYPDFPQAMLEPNFSPYAQTV